MIDAYTIGITLALEDGVSEGVVAIRHDLAALDSDSAGCFALYQACFRWTGRSAACYSGRHVTCVAIGRAIRTIGAWCVGGDAVTRVGGEGLPADIGHAPSKDTRPRGGTLNRLAGAGSVGSSCGRAAHHADPT